MNTNLQDTILKITDTAAETEDYTGEDGLLYCGKCHKPKEAYFPEGKTLFGRDRHPAECDCLLFGKLNAAFSVRLKQVFQST